MQILLKLWKPRSRQPITRYSSNPRVLGQLVRLANFHKAYLKVSYGKDIDCFGKLTEFYNDGEYTDKKELSKAFKAFIEK